MTPTTFRPIAQCLNQMRYCVPHKLVKFVKFKQRYKPETSSISRSQPLLSNKLLIEPTHPLLYLNRYRPTKRNSSGNQWTPWAKFHFNQTVLYTGKTKRTRTLTQFKSLRQLCNKMENN